VLRWPSSADVLRAAALWAERQRCNHGDLLAVGVFGSYGRGDAGVGSDLDLVLISAGMLRSPLGAAAPLGYGLSAPGL